MTNQTIIHKNVNVLTFKNSLSRIFKTRLKHFEKVFETSEKQGFSNQ